MKVKVHTNNGLNSDEYEDVGSFATQDDELWLYREEDFEDAFNVYPKGGWTRLGVLET